MRWKTTAITFYLILMSSMTPASAQYYPVGYDFRAQYYRDKSVLPPDTPEWDAGKAQVTCDKSEALTGISVLSPGGDAQGNVALCTTITDADFTGGARTAPLFFEGRDNRRASRGQGGDWARNYYKLECGLDEYVIGVSQQRSPGANKFHGLQCAKGVYFDQTLTWKERVRDTGDARGSSKGTNWDPSHFLMQCADNEYLVGVSLSPSDGAPHSILCSTLPRLPAALHAAYATINPANRIGGTSTPDGNAFRTVRNYDETNQIEGSPAIAAFNGQLYIAYKSKASNHLNLLCIASSPDRGDHYRAPVCISNLQLLDSPAMAVFNGKLHIAVRSTDNQLSIISTADAAAFTQITYSNIRLQNSPAIAAFSGKIYVAFKANDSSNKLFVTSAADVASLPVAQRYDNIQLQNSPAMTAFKGRLYIAFKSNDSDNKLFVTSAADGRNFQQPAQAYNNIRLQNSPAMAAFNGKLYIAFKANDSDNKLFVTSAVDGSAFQQPARGYDGYTFQNSPALATQFLPDTLANVRFAVYGDMPYGAKVNPLEDRDDAQLLGDRILPRLSEIANLPFIFHVGDIGRPGGTPGGGLYNSCTDAFRASTRTSWSALNKPMFFTPGDNDWTDCNNDRLPTPRYNPLVELGKIGTQFFSADSNKDRANFSDFAQQTDYPENQMWSLNDILYITLHVVGSRNGVVPPDKEDAANRNREAANRENATVSWIGQARTKMAASSFAALVIAFHVDPFKPDWKCWTSGGDYGRICNALKDAAITVQKPVLLVHGDTNAHCLRKYETPNTSLWVLNAPGDFNSLDADIVSFDKTNISNPFSVVSLISGSSPSSICDYAE